MSYALRPGTEAPDMSCRAEWLIGDRLQGQVFSQVTRQKAPKIARFSRLRTRPQCCAQFANRRLRLLLIDAHPRRFADPQDDSIFHPRTWHRAAGCARTLGRLSNHPTRPRRASRGNGAAAANQPRRVMKTIAFVSWQIVDDDDISGPQRWRQR